MRALFYKIFFNYLTISPKTVPLKAPAFDSSVSICIAKAYFSDTRITVSPNVKLRPVSVTTLTSTI